MRGDEERPVSQTAISHDQVIIPFFKDLLVVHSVELADGNQVGLALQCYGGINTVEQEMAQKYGMHVEAQKVFAKEDPLPLVIKVPMVSDTEFLFWPMKYISHSASDIVTIGYEDKLDNHPGTMSAICSLVFGNDPIAQKQMDHYLMARRWFSGR